MKYYSYQEHHVFCVESGIDSCLLWKQGADLGWLPDGIYHNPANAFNPKQKEYRSTPEFKARVRKYQSKPKVKAMRKNYQSSPEYQTWLKKYRSTPEYRMKRVDGVKKWRKANPGKRKVWDGKYTKKMREYHSTPEYKARRKEWDKKRNKK